MRLVELDYRSGQDQGIAEMIEWLDQPGKYKQWEKLTSQEATAVQEEIRRCKGAFTYAARNYFRVVSKDKIEQYFDLFEVQELILEHLQWLQDQNRPAKMMICKARQLGASTLVEAIMAWLAMFYANTNCLVVSYDPDHAAYLFSLMQFVYDKMPWWLQPMCSSRKYETGLVFENPDPAQRRVNPGMNSRITVDGANKMTGVGQGVRYNGAHLSEVSNWRNAQSVIEEDVKNALVAHWTTVAVIESTPRGRENYYYKLWTKMVELGERAGWSPKFYAWFFEKTRVLSPPQGWKIETAEMEVRDAIAMDWVRCAGCNSFFDRFFQRRDQDGSLCIKCQAAPVVAFELSDQQAYWMQLERQNADLDLQSQRILKQEMASTALMAFVASGTPAVPDHCQDWVARTVRRPLYRGMFDRRDNFHAVDYKAEACCLSGCGADHRFDPVDVTVWEMPILGAKYFIGADVSEGIEQDYSVACVLRVGCGASPDVQVASFRSNKTDPIEFAGVLKSLGRMYNEAEIAIEINRYDSTATYLRFNLLYPNLYRTKNLDAVNVVSGKYGWLTTPKTKKTIFVNLVSRLAAKMVVVRSANLLEEVRSFQRDDASSVTMGAGANSFDDELMALMIALFGAHELEYDENLGYVPIQRAISIESAPYILVCSRCKTEAPCTDPSTMRACPKCECLLVSFRSNASMALTLEMYTQNQEGDGSSQTDYDQL